MKQISSQEMNLLLKNTKHAAYKEKREDELGG